MLHRRYLILALATFICSVAGRSINICEAPELKRIDETNYDTSEITINCSSGMAHLTGGYYSVHRQSAKEIFIDIKAWIAEESKINIVNKEVLELLNGIEKKTFMSQMMSTSPQGYISGILRLMGSGGVNGVHTNKQIKEGLQNAGLSQSSQKKFVKLLLGTPLTSKKIATRIVVNNYADTLFRGRLALFTIDCIVKSSYEEKHIRLASNNPVLLSNEGESISARYSTALDESTDYLDADLMKLDSVPENDELENVLSEIDPKTMANGFSVHTFETLESGKSFKWTSKYIEGKIKIEGTCITLVVDWVYRYKMNLVHYRKCSPRAEICQGISRYIFSMDVCAEINDAGVLLTATFALGKFKHTFSHQYAAEDLIPWEEMKSLSTSKCNDDVYSFPTLSADQIACIERAVDLLKDHSSRWTAVYPSAFGDISRQAHLSWLRAVPGQSAHFKCNHLFKEGFSRLGACKGAATRLIENRCCGSSYWPSKPASSIAILHQRIDKCLPKC